MPPLRPDKSSTESTRSGRVFKHFFSFTGWQVEQGFLARVHTHCLQTALRPLQEEHGIIRSMRSRRDSQCVENHLRITKMEQVKVHQIALIMCLLLLLLSPTGNKDIIIIIITSLRTT